MPTIDETLVSVIIPNFNYGRFIKEAIMSVAAQTHSSIELIVVDDGSTDGSGQAITQVLESLHDWSGTASAIYLEKNRGFNAAVNSAAGSIKGYAVILLDSDDKLKPTYVSETLAVLLREEQNGVGIVYGHSHLIDENGKIIGELRSEKFDPDLLDYKSYIPGNALTLARAFKPLLPLDENIRRAIKWNRWKLIVGNGFRGFYVEESLFEYRMHDQNASGIGNRMLEQAKGEKPGVRRAQDYWPVGTNSAK